MAVGSLFGSGAALCGLPRIVSTELPRAATALPGNPGAQGAPTSNRSFSFMLGRMDFRRRMWMPARRMKP